MALATSSVESLPPSPRRVRVAAATGHVVGAHFVFGGDDPSRIGGLHQWRFPNVWPFSFSLSRSNINFAVRSSAIETGIYRPVIFDFFAVHSLRRHGTPPHCYS